MRSIKSLIRVSIVCGVVAFSIAEVPAQSVRLVDATRRLNWPNSVLDLAVANRTSPDEVTDFLNSLQGKEAAPPVRVGEFRFAKLEKTKMGLVATVDASGRDLYYGVYVIFPEGAEFRRVVLPSAPPHFLPREILDLDGDGVDEVITKQPVGGYQGANTDLIYWFSIFRFRGGLPEDVSANFPEFYRRAVLPDMDYLMQVLALAENEGFHAGRLHQAKVEFVQFKFRRKILGEKDAGFQEAMAWAESEDRKLQELAIAAFEEIPGPQSLEGLDKLARSTDPRISGSARNALARIRAKSK